MPLRAEKKQNKNMKKLSYKKCIKNNLQGPLTVHFKYTLFTHIGVINTVQYICL